VSKLKIYIRANCQRVTIDTKPINHLIVFRW